MISITFFISPIICQTTWFHLCVQILPTFLFYCKSPSYKLLLITSTWKFIKCFPDVHVDKTLVKKPVTLVWHDLPLVNFTPFYINIKKTSIFKICSEVLYVTDSHSVQLSFAFYIYTARFFFRWHNSQLNEFTNPVPPETHLGSWGKKLTSFPSFSTLNSLVLLSFKCLI